VGRYNWFIIGYRAKQRREALGLKETVAPFLKAKTFGKNCVIEDASRNIEVFHPLTGQVEGGSEQKQQKEKREKKGNDARAAPADSRWRESPLDTRPTGGLIQDDVRHLERKEEKGRHESQKGCGNIEVKVKQNSRKLRRFLQRKTPSFRRDFSSFKPRRSQRQREPRAEWASPWTSVQILLNPVSSTPRKQSA